MRAITSCLVLIGLFPALVMAAELNGELDWAQQVDLSVPLTGRINEVAVKVGDEVQSDQLLVQFDQRTARAHVAQARAALTVAEQQRSEARRERERAKELFDRTVLSERELQLAEIEYANAESHYQSARAAQVAADVELEYGRLVAPFAAWVLQVHVAPGETVVNNAMVAPLVMLAARDRMQVRSSVNAAQAGMLTLGSNVDVGVGDQRYAGQLVSIGLEPTSDTRPALYSVQVEFSVPPDHTLRAGQAAIVILP